MHSDEQEIRELVARWMAATREGNTEAVLSLMTEDAVFLLPGRPPMNKAEFTAAARAQSNPQQAPRVEGHSEIQEIQVLGDWAFMWTSLTVTVTPPSGSPAKRAGNTLSILRKQKGKWRLARDANLLTPVNGANQPH